MYQDPDTSGGKWVIELAVKSLPVVNLCASIAWCPYAQSGDLPWAILYCPILVFTYCSNTIETRELMGMRANLLIHVIFYGLDLSTEYGTMN